MGRQKYDGVVEAVRYAPDGKLAIARVYERRGSTFSDYVLMTRAEMISRLKAGQLFMIGKRLEYMGGTFEVTVPVKMAGNSGKEVLFTTEITKDCDDLQGAPLF
ncbi:MAG: hypothetical protein P4L50_10360 [Anaerolineaceae bacterium]|nr:hypothetical protein [Anaerolineaceae bacterium]